MYFVTIYNENKANDFEMTLNQLWLGYEKKRDGFFKIVADELHIDKLRNLIGWDKILRVA